MKNSKIVALVATAALLVIGAAFTSMAATYNWYQVDGIWHCKDKSGDDYNQAFAKSGSDMYWLDENGEMVTEYFLEEDGNYYYFDETGKMVKNDWKKVENTDDDEGDEYYWYYFQNSGKAIKAKYKPVSVTGKKYLFAEDGKMLYGWVSDGAMNDADNAWSTETYYCGDADDGSVKYGWQQLDVIDEEDADSEEQTYWFYFGTNGQKVKAAVKDDLFEKTVNGKKYAFDYRGVMKASWEPTFNTAATTTISSYAWFHTAEDGAKMKKGWFRVVPTDVINATDNEEDTSHWYYALGGGALAENEIKTINGKKYGFNGKGEMVSGLWYITNPALIDGEFDDAERCIDEEAEVNALTTKAGIYNGGSAYFFGDEETDGSMKTGTITTEIDGDNYTFYFGTTGAKKYQANDGWKKNAYYVNGAKLKGDADLRYQMFEIKSVPAGFGYGTTTDLTGIVLDPVGKPNTTAYAANKYVLVSSSGAFVKNATTKKDADGVKYSVTNYIVTGKN